MLIVMENRDVHEFAQALFDDEAAGRFDVFEIDTAEGRPEQLNAIDELVDIFAVDLEIDAVDVGKALEQHGLAFHHGLGAQSAEIAEAEHGRAVRNHRDHIALGRVFIGFCRVCLDRKAGRRHTGRIGERQITLGGQRLGGRDLDLAGLAAAMQLQSFVIGD